MLEALWTVEFNTRGGWNGGAVVLKAGHVFGGDSGMYYTGTYNRTNDKTLSGDLRLTRWAGQGPTAWGDSASVVDCAVNGTVDGDKITGKVSRVGHPALDFRMQRRAALPE